MDGIINILLNVCMYGSIYVRHHICAVSCMYGVIYTSMYGVIHVWCYIWLASFTDGIKYKCLVLMQQQLVLCKHMHMHICMCMHKHQ